MAFWVLKSAVISASMSRRSSFSIRNLFIIWRNCSFSWNSVNPYLGHFGNVVERHLRTKNPPLFFKQIISREFSSKSKSLLIIIYYLFVHLYFWNHVIKLFPWERVDQWAYFIFTPTGCPPGVSDWAAQTFLSKNDATQFSMNYFWKKLWFIPVLVEYHFRSCLQLLRFGHLWFVQLFPQFGMKSRLKMSHLIWVI